MTKKVEHLYIHVPFCKSICSYCDFVRSIPKCAGEINRYLINIVKDIKHKCKSLKFKTIYVGGGTPNSLTNEQLKVLLSELSKHLKKTYEFTIECNPEFINQSQIDIFKKYKVNRISLGVQTRNNKILKEFNRKHTNAQVDKAIKLLQKNKLNNISVDFIYGYSKMTKQDIDKDIKFVLDNHIPHASFYSLELKSNSILTKSKYQLDDELIDKQLAYIIKKFKDINYARYEVSNWCLNKKYQSQHNLAYWNTKPWKAFGNGAYGFENMIYYHIDKDKKISHIYSCKEYYQHILIMGLRLVNGFDLKNQDHKKAWDYFKNKIDPKLYFVKNNNVIVKDINKLDDILINII